MVSLSTLTTQAKTLLTSPAPKPKAGATPAAPAAFPTAVGPTESLVDVVALVGNALLLDNGDFVRVLEVAPVDLEQGNEALKHQYWGMFANALRRLRAPMRIQIVVTTQPQDISAYLDRWDRQAREWRQLAEDAPDAETRARREVMAKRALETGAFLAAAHARLGPQQQRYLIVVPFNPFPETVSHKKQTQLLDDKRLTAGLEKLDERVQTVRMAMSEVGLPVYDLDPAEMCAALWDHYHHPASLLGGGLDPRLALDRSDPAGHAPTQCPAPEEFLAAARDKDRLAYLIAPEMIEETAEYVRLGEALARGYEIYDFDPRRAVDFSALLSFPADVSHALYIEAADPVALRQRYKDKETELKAAAFLDVRRGAVADHGRNAAVNSIESARAEMEVALQAPFFLRWYCVLWANDAETLEKKSQQFETQLRLRDLRYRRATRRHLSVVQSARPVMRAVYALTPRNMSAESLGSFFPFIRREYLNPEGWHYGLHRGSGLLICLDPFEGGRANASELILGAPRSGKSVYLKQQVETALALGHRVFMFDPEREALGLAIDHHGLYVELGKRADPRRLPTLDPLRPDSLREALADLGGLYESLSATRLTETEQEAVLHAYLATLTEAGIDYARPATWSQTPPLLADFLSHLRPRASEAARVLAYADALSGGGTINIMDINFDSENPWSAAAESLAAFVEAIRGQRLDALTFNALVDGYQQTMLKWGFNPDQPAASRGRPAPRLAELVSTLAAMPDSRAQELSQVLKQYAFGLYADLFNCATNVDIGNAQLVVFGMRSLRENVERNLAPVFAWQVLRLIWNQIVAASGSGQPTHVFVDEAWYLLEQPGAALRLEHMTRSFPKYSAALHLATHDSLKLAQSAEAQIIRDMARVKVLFKQESESAARALGIFGLTADEQSELMRLRRGEGWLLFGHETHLPLYVAVNPLRLDRLSTNAEQMQAIAQASGRKGVPVV